MSLPPDKSDVALRRFGLAGSDPLPEINCHYDSRSSCLEISRLGQHPGLRRQGFSKENFYSFQFPWTCGGKTQARFLCP